MSSQFANLIIKRIIIHEVFCRNDNRDIKSPKLSKELTSLVTEGIDVFNERIISALGDDSHSMEMEIIHDDNESVFQISASVINEDDGKFVSISQKLPLKLAEAQISRNIPGGILVIFDGTIGPNNLNFIGIIKAEIHSGFLKEEKTDSLRIKFIADLLLTPQQKLYKIGFFIEKNKSKISKTHRSPIDFDAYVYDHNMTSSETRQAAKYFYETFLGCKIAPSNKKQTSDFYYYTKEFIDSLSIDDEEKVDLHTSLYTYLKLSQKQTINIKEFSEEFMTKKLKSDYLAQMEEKGVTKHNISKDITYIKSQLRRRKLSFTSKVKIIAPSDNFEDLVKIEEYSDDHTSVRIKGRIENN